MTQSAELFVVVGDLLREGPASPALREALYDVAANIPGGVGYTYVMQGPATSAP